MASGTIYGSESLSTAAETAAPLLGEGLPIFSFMATTQTLTSQAGKGLSDMMTLGNEFTLVISPIRQLNDTMTLQSLFTCYVDRLDYVGTPLTMGITEITSSVRTLDGILGLPNVSLVTDDQLLVEFVCGSLAVVLPAPEFDNIHSVDLRTIRRETRGGDYVTYRDPEWELTEKFEITFKSLTRAERDVFQSFLLHTVGLVIDYTDMYGNVWAVICINPEAEFTQEITGYSINVQLQRFTG